MELTREHFRAIIFHNFRRGLSQEQCLAELVSVYELEAPSKTTIYRWYSEFRRGRSSLRRSKRSGNYFELTSVKGLMKVKEAREVYKIVAGGGLWSLLTLQGKRRDVIYPSEKAKRKMIRNKNIVRSDVDVMVPAKLNFGDAVLKKLLQFKDNIFLINGATEEQITYGEILQQTMNVAISLTHLGVGKGETVGLLSENRNELFPAALGVICTGATLTTFNVGYTAGEMIHVLNISKPTAIVCSPETYKSHLKSLKSSGFIKTFIIFGDEKMHNTISYNSIAIPKNVNSNVKEIFNVKSNELLRDIKYDEFEVPDVKGQKDTALILYSSGTTGLPKGVMLTHLNVLATFLLPPSTDPTFITLTITPWSHTFGLVGNFMTMSQGRTTVYLSKFEPQLYLKTIERYKIAQIVVVPPVLVALCKLEFKYDVSTVRLIYSGAAPLREDTVQALKNKFPNAKVLQGYGMTETTLSATRDLYNKAHLTKIGGVGWLINSSSVKVADLQTGEALGPLKQGEICIKSPQVMKGYIGIRPEEWRDEEGYLRTGDIGYYDEDGCFFVVDRLKELIKYKGYQVPPAEIEAVLLTHPAVNDVGVVGEEHREAGEVPVAFVVKRPGADVTEEEIKAFVAERHWLHLVALGAKLAVTDHLNLLLFLQLSNPKHLRGGVRFVDQIPKSVTGKILRKTLREMLRSRKSKL